MKQWEKEERRKWYKLYVWVNEKFSLTIRISSLNNLKRVQQLQLRNTDVKAVSGKYKTAGNPVH
jgi:hypothetical protein